MNLRCILLLVPTAVITLSIAHAQSSPADALNSAAALLSASPLLPLTGLQVKPLAASSPFSDSAWVWREAYNDFPNGMKHHEKITVFFKDGRYVVLWDILSGDTFSEDSVSARRMTEQGRWKLGSNGMAYVSDFVSHGKPIQGTTCFKIQNETLLAGRDERDFDSNSKYNQKRLNAKAADHALKNANEAKWK